VEDVLGTSNFLRGVRLSSSLFVESHEDRFHVAKLSCMQAAFRAEEATVFEDSERDRAMSFVLFNRPGFKIFRATVT
jgi:hypothetical protein